MKKVLLVLEIIEGRDWNPKEGNKTLFEAHLDSHKLSTNVFPLTNSPKFNTEVTWEAGKETLRSYKLNRVPIKLECFALDEKKNRKLLGYIVLPLTTAVEGVEADSKWYKLLGGAKGTHKTAPSILLRLHLEAMTFDQHTQVNGKQLRNGTQALEDIRMSSVLEKKKVLQGRIDLLNPSQTNGSDDYGQYPQFQNQDPLFTGTSNGNCVERSKIMDEMDSDNMDDEGEVEDEELLDSEECSDDGQNASIGMIVEAYSINEGIEDAKSDSCSLDAEPGKSQVPNEENNSEIQKHASERGAENCRVQSGLLKKAPNSLSDTNLGKMTKKNSDCESLLKTRASAREHLHKLSESLRPFNNERLLLEQSNASNSNYSFEKRILDTSTLFDRSFERKNKSRKANNSMETSLTDAPHDPNRNRKEECDLSSELKLRLSQCKEATSAGFLLSQSLIGEPSRTSKPQQKESSSTYKYLSHTKLFPQLNQEEGCFYIGPRAGEQEEDFTFSVTIVYAKNLRTIIPRDVIPSTDEGFRFCYSLLGYSIYTDAFLDLDNPEFVAEKASAKVRSSNQSLSLYFSQHYFLPVHFMSGDICLGTCTVDIGFLIDIASKNKSKFEGVFQLNSVDKGLPRASDSYKHKAVIAMAFEISKSPNSISFSSISKYSPFSTERKPNNIINPVSVSDSASSCSEREEEVRFKKKGKTRKKRARYSLKNYLNEDECLQAERENEREKKMLLLEAAYEVEKWKEEQQKHFLKEWSAKEETLQTLLATEWCSKIKIIEEELSHRLTECDKLQEKLNQGLSQLSLREEKFKLKENQVKKLEQELLLEKERLQISKLKDNQHGTENTSVKKYFSKQVDAEKQRNEQLQKEVSKLEEDLKKSEEQVKSQTQEVISLRRKLVLTDDIIGVAKEKEVLHNKIESLQERKQYYKAQWLNALTDLHKFHSAHKRAIDDIAIDIKNCSSEFPPRHSSPLEPSTDAIKLRKLKDERKILLGTGFYPSNHSIIRNIDKKIKDLIG